MNEPIQQTSILASDKRADSVVIHSFIQY